MNDLFNYITLAKNAEALIYKFGDKCVVTGYKDVPNPDPIKPPTRTPTSKDTRGVWLRYKLQDVDGTNILRGDQMVLLAGKIEVDPRGIIHRGSEAWKIVATGTQLLKPGPTSMLWKVQVRQ